MSLGVQVPRMPQSSDRMPGSSAGLPGMPGGTPRMPRMPRKPRIGDPRVAARSTVSRNPIVKRWRRLKANRYARKLARSRKKQGRSAASGAGLTAGGTPQAHQPEGVRSATVAPVQQQAPMMPAPAPTVAAPARATTPPSPAAASPTRTVTPPERAPAPAARAAAPDPAPSAHGPASQRHRGRAAEQAEGRAARRSEPRLSRRRRLARERAMWRSLLEVGRAQWGADFDQGGLDRRFIGAFATRTRLIVTVPHPDGRRRRIVGLVEVAGFSPEGELIVSTDPTEGRIAARPEFQIRSAAHSDPVSVSHEMAILAFETPNGRFRMLAGSSG